MTYLPDYFSQLRETGRIATPPPASPLPATRSPSLSATLTKWEVRCDQNKDYGKTTPIADLYLREIGGAKAGDQLITLQKYIKQEDIVNALVRADLKGVKVTAVYRDKLSPECKKFSSSREIEACKRIFRRSDRPHHKSMMVLKAEGTVRAIVGSYNPADKHEKFHVHTALFFEVPKGQALFKYYEAEKDRLLGLSTSTSRFFTLNTQHGIMEFTMHPNTACGVTANPVLTLLSGLPACRNTTIWLSYYGACDDVNDVICRPVFIKLHELQVNGCTVRVLLDSKSENDTADEKLQALGGIEVRRASSSLTLGHKLVLAKAGDEVRVIQSSANLSRSDHCKKHNLTLYMRGKGFRAIHDALELEIRRYWGK